MARFLQRHPKNPLQILLHAQNPFRGQNIRLLGRTGAHEEIGLKEIVSDAVASLSHGKSTPTDTRITSIDCGRMNEDGRID